MKERFKTPSAVFLLLMRNNNGIEEILMQKRKNTGYCDGYYDLCVGGHVESFESMKQTNTSGEKVFLSLSFVF